MSIVFTRISGSQPPLTKRIMIGYSSISYFTVFGKEMARMRKSEQKAALCPRVKAGQVGFAILLAEPPPVYLPYIAHS
jgi:hypothetical protein